MGCTVREKAGCWWLFVHHDGRRTSRRIGPGDQGKKAAKAAAAKIAAKLATGDTTILEKEKPLTFAECADRWLTDYAEPHCKLGSVEEYRKVLRLYLLPTFGPRPLAEIARDEIKAFLAAKLRSGSTRWKNRPLSPASVKAILLVLQSVFTKAVDDKLLSSNPAARLGRFAKRKDKTADDRMDVFTKEELAHLLAVAEHDLPEAYPPILTLAKTGIRSSELFGLQPDDLDFTRQILWVRRAIAKKRVGTTKNGKVRRVDLSPQLGRVLRDHLSRRAAEAVLAGQEPSPWVFPLPTGEPMTPGYLYDRLWNPLLDRAGLRRRGPHQLRHTYASLLIGQGANPKYVQEQLGHHSIQITLDLYAHLFEGDHRHHVEALDGVLDAPQNTPRAPADAPKPIPPPVFTT